jgi:phosphocarrier protein FPr
VVGVVVVSHSARLAEGVVELAAQMAGPELRMSAAGGLDEPGGALGTDATKVLAAVEDVWSGDGVLVLMDLGSAVLSAELAVDLLGEERRGKVLLTEAPLVEGAVAAAVAASLGEPLAAVAAAARGGLEAKAAQLAPAASAERATDAGTPEDAEPERCDPESLEGVEPASTKQPGPRAEDGESIRVTVRNPLGLHARPAALLVRTAAGYDAAVTIADVTNGRGPVGARSLTGVATLGARRDHELVVTAVGPQAAEALAAIRRLADGAFGEPEAPGAAAAPTEAAPVPAMGVDTPAAVTAPEPPSAGSVLAGIAVTPGIAVGPARRLRRVLAPLPASTGPADDPAAECDALEHALCATAQDIRRAQTSVAGRAGARDAAIFDAHLLLLEDEALLTEVRAAVSNRHEAAGHAWQRAVAAAAVAWDALEDPYQRARAADLRDVGAQVLSHLSGAGAAPDATVEGILIAPDLTPADAAALDPATTTGVALAGGSPASHAAILIRALGVPAVAGAGAALLAVPDGTPLSVDGDAGAVTVAPTPESVAAAERRSETLARDAAAAKAAASRPAVTRDGVTVHVEANIAGPQDVRDALACGADGVGLLRTEFVFLGSDSMPDEDEQTAAYAAVADALGGRPLTIRTLDAGADKPLPYLALPAEANPFLGVRGLRLSLACPEQLERQLRAVLRAAVGRDVRVMFPMVADVDELRRAREALEQARASLRTEGVPVPDRIETGIMLEVPSAALLAETLAPLVDFFSVGTNDLTQYTLAAERGNPGVAGLFDPLHPAVLRLIESATKAAAAAGRRVAVCGEVAGDRLAVPLLVGLGVTELSMNSVSIPAAKQAVRATRAGLAVELAREALAAESAPAVRRLLAAASPAADEAVPSTPPRGNERTE